MRLPSALRAFLAGSALLTLLCLGTEAFCHLALHWGYPYDYPGVRSTLLFGDFHDFFDKFVFFHSRGFFSHGGTLPYPAPAAAAYAPFLIPQPTPHHGSAAIARYEGSLLLAAGTMLVLLRRALLREGLLRSSATLFVLGTCAFSFAFWFEFAQGNIEWVIWTLLMGGIWCVCHRRFAAAAVCFGIAGSMKFYPIIFVGLLFSLRQFRAVLLTAATAVLSTVAGLWLICPDIAYSWTHTLAGLGRFEQTYMVKVRPVEVGFDHSLFALVKLCLGGFTGIASRPAPLAPYLATVAMAGCVAYFLRIRRLPLTNQVLCLTVAAVVLPPLSYDYTLIHLYAGFAMLAVFALQQQRSGQLAPRGLTAAFLLLGFTLAPESEFFHAGVRVAGQLKCLSLLALGYISLRYPFPVQGLPDADDSLQLPSPLQARFPIEPPPQLQAAIPPPANAATRLPPLPHGV